MANKGINEITYEEAVKDLKFLLDSRPVLSLITGSKKVGSEKYSNFLDELRSWLHEWNEYCITGYTGKEQTPVYATPKKVIKMLTDPTTEAIKVLDGYIIEANAVNEDTQLSIFNLDD